MFSIIIIFIPLCRKMVLQSESADEEDEHFEDIVEETDYRTTSASDKQENDAGPVENGGAAVSDSDSSEDEEETPVSASEDEVSDEADEFLIRDDAKDVKKSTTRSGSSGKQSQVSSKRPSLPGGYDPRHREPSYWWVISSKLLLIFSWSYLFFHFVFHGQQQCRSCKLVGADGTCFACSSLGFEHGKQTS